MRLCSMSILTVRCPGGSRQCVKERRIPFVFSTGYDVTNVLPDFLVGSAVIGKPYKSDELERRYVR